MNPDRAPRSRMVRIAPGCQTDVFDASVMGVEPITRNPRPVAEDLLPAVRKAAKVCGVSLRVERNRS